MDLEEELDKLKIITATLARAVLMYNAELTGRGPKDLNNE